MTEWSVAALDRNGDFPESLPAGLATIRLTISRAATAGSDTLWRKANQPEQNIGSFTPLPESMATGGVVGGRNLPPFWKTWLVVGFRKTALRTAPEALTMHSSHQNCRSLAKLQLRTHRQRTLRKHEKQNYKSSASSMPALNGGRFAIKFSNATAAGVACAA